MIGFYFTGNGRRLHPPVNPAEFTVTWGGNNKKTEVVGIGEINILRSPKLATFSLEFLFPGDDYYPFITGDWQNPDKLVSYFLSAQNKERSLRLAISELNFNMRLSVEGVTPTRKAGDHESVVCSVAFSQYKNYGANVLSVPKVVGAKAKAVTAPRPSDKASSQTHTIKYGDTLWAIAQRELGSGSRYPEIAALNSFIKDPNKIYPPDVLKLPAR